MKTTEPKPAKHVKLAIVTGGIAGCAVAVRAGLNGFANDNPPAAGKLVRLSRRADPDAASWPAGLALHTAVLMDLGQGKTLVRVTYPKAG